MRRFALATSIVLFLAGCRNLAPTDIVDLSEQKTGEFLKDHKLNGKVVLIHFGAMGCDLSATGLTNMTALCRDNKIPDLLYFRVEESSNPDCAKMSPGFPVFQDSGTSIALAFQATTYPCYVLVDKFGHVRYRGSLPLDRLSEWTGKLSAEQTDLGADVPLLDSLQLDIPQLLTSTQLPELGGKSAKPLAEYTGERGLMLVFVDTSCPFSKQIIEEMPEAALALGKHKINTLLVNIDDAEEVVKSFYGARVTGSPVVFDVGSDTRLKWRVESVPTIVMVSSGNQLLYRGAAVWQKVARAGERGLNLPDGSIVFKSKGTEFG